MSSAQAKSGHHMRASIAIQKISCVVTVMLLSACGGGGGGGDDGGSPNPQRVTTLSWTKEIGDPLALKVTYSDSVESATVYGDRDDQGRLESVYRIEHSTSHGATNLEIISPKETIATTPNGVTVLRRLNGDNLDQFTFSGADGLPRTTYFLRDGTFVSHPGATSVNNKDAALSDRRMLPQAAKGCDRINDGTIPVTISAKRCGEAESMAGKVQIGIKQAGRAYDTCMTEPGTYRGYIPRADAEALINPRELTASIVDALDIACQVATENGVASHAVALSACSTIPFPLYAAACITTFEAFALSCAIKAAAGPGLDQAISRMVDLLPDKAVPATASAFIPAIPTNISGPEVEIDQNATGISLELDDQREIVEDVIVKPNPPQTTAPYQVEAKVSCAKPGSATLSIEGSDGYKNNTAREVPLGSAVRSLVLALEVPPAKSSTVDTLDLSWAPKLGSPGKKSVKVTFSTGPDPAESRVGRICSAEEAKNLYQRGANVRFNWSFADSDISYPGRTGPRAIFLNGLPLSLHIGLGVSNFDYVAGGQVSTTEAWKGAGTYKINKGYLDLTHSTSFDKVSPVSGQIVVLSASSVCTTADHDLIEKIEGTFSGRYVKANVHDVTLKDGTFVGYVRSCAPGYRPLWIDAITFVCR